MARNRTARTLPDGRRRPRPRRCLLEKLESRLPLATFLVNTTADTPDAFPGDGIAADENGLTSLRAAVMEANATASTTPATAHEIVLPAGVYRLTIADDPDAPGAASGDLDVRSHLRILGAGSQETIVDAGGPNGILDRLFFVDYGARLELFDVTLTGGVASGEDLAGGALQNYGEAHIYRSMITGNRAARGGGVYSAGRELAISGSTVDGNAAAANGGGLFVEYGSLRVDGSTLSNNTAGEDGGGILVRSSLYADIELVNVTVSGNAAQGDGGGVKGVPDPVGYASFPDQSSDTSDQFPALRRLWHGTITENSAGNSGGGVDWMDPQTPADLEVQNTIIANNSAAESDDDIRGAFVSQGGNLIGDAGSASGFADGVQGDRVGGNGAAIDPLLGPLQDNGGPTATHLPLRGSPALDGATGAAAEFDQRGMLRPQDGDGDGVAAADIGAVELLPALIHGVKWHDVDGSGQRDEGEPPLGGWTIFLDFDGDLARGDDEPFRVTERDGSYAFAGLAPGTYTVIEEPLLGWLPTSPVSRTVTLDEGGIEQIDFANYRLGSIGGYAFRDTDGDGFDGQEPRLAEVSVTLFEAGADRLFGTGDDEIRTVPTGADGQYRFDDLFRGLYRVRQATPAGWVQTTEDPHDIDLLSGQVYVAHADQLPPLDDDQTGLIEPLLAFGSAPLATIQGVKWNDLDGDGTRDPGEPGVPGWTIHLSDPEGNVLDTTVTDAGGRYAFADLWPGTYVVAEALLPGAEPTFPSGRFAQPLPIATGTIVSSALVADLNGDGAQDVVVANDYFNTVSGRSGLTVLLNGNRAESWQRLDVELGIGVRPQSITAADVDGDQDLDLIVASIGDPYFGNSQANALLLLRNNGDGTFGAAERLAAGNYPLRVIAADLNGDGRMDLVAANLKSQDVSVLLGGPGGRFGAPLNIAVGSEPLAVQAADIDGDGLLDLVVAVHGEDQIALLRGDGRGRFSPLGRLSGFHRPADVALGDFDGDGHLDLAVANYGINQIAALRGDGRGNFVAQSAIAVGSQPQRIAVGDVNGDGRPDLLSANEGDASVSLALNDGDGTFGVPFRIAVPRIGQGWPSPQHVVLGDLDGDSNLDLVVPHFAHGITVHLNNIRPHTVAVSWGDVVQRDFGNRFSGGSSPEPLLLAAPARDNSRHNYVSAEDVNGDGQLSPIDPLLIINYLNAGRTAEGEEAFFPDVDGDGIVVPRDVLMVINALNAPLEQRPVAAPFALTQAAAEAVMDTAIELWSAAGIPPEMLDRLRSVQVRIADLPDSMLGLSRSGIITLDTTAAGYGWHVDSGPAVSAFAPAGRTEAGEISDARRVDLLTAVLHELGHILGRADEPSGTGSLMDAHLPLGQRRLPAPIVDALLTGRETG